MWSADVIREWPLSWRQGSNFPPSLARPSASARHAIRASNANEAGAEGSGPMEPADIGNCLDLEYAFGAGKQNSSARWSFSSSDLHAYACLNEGKIVGADLDRRSTWNNGKRCPATATSSRQSREYYALQPALYNRLNLSWLPKKTSIKDVRT